MAPASLLGCDTAHPPTDGGTDEDAGGDEDGGTPDRPEGPFDRAGGFVLRAEVPVGENTAIRHFVLYTDERGRPTHLRDDFFQEMIPMAFSDGIDVLVRRGIEGMRTITIREDDQCISLEHDGFFGIPPHSDTAELLDGSAEACPTGVEVRLEVTARGSEVPSVLLPGSGVRIESSYPLDLSEDRFEMRIDGEVRNTARSADAPNRWTLTPSGPVPFGADVELTYTGTRSLPTQAMELTTLEPTTEIMTDFSLETPIPAGARSGAGPYDGAAGRVG